MGRWITTAVSHTKMMYEAHGIPWNEKDEKIFQAILSLIDNQVDDKFIENALQDLYISFGLENQKNARSKFIKILEEAGVKIKKAKNED